MSVQSFRFHQRRSAYIDRLAATDSIPPILISRFLLNLRALNEGEYAGSALMTMSGSMQFNSRAFTDIGAPIDYSDPSENDVDDCVECSNTSSITDGGDGASKLSQPDSEGTHHI